MYENRYWHRYNISPILFWAVNLEIIVQLMACRQFGAKVLSEPMLDIVQLNPKEHNSMKCCLQLQIFR